MVSHVLWFIPDRYAGVLRDACRASFSCVLVSRRTLKTPGLSISRIFTKEGPPVGYTGAVKPPVRRTGNRESGHKETDI